MREFPIARDLNVHPFNAPETIIQHQTIVPVITRKAPGD
jgi:hypothetical protein